jgi:tripartite-type tricarboxylate transporter receptor subunit TctC
MKTVFGRLTRRVATTAMLIAPFVAPLVSPSAVRAQAFPSHDITLVVPFAPGGSTDVIARQYALMLGKELGGSITVENKPGGAGSIGTTEVVKAAPDGYTLGLAAVEVLAYQPVVHPNLVYKSTADYTPIVKLGNRPSVLFVRPDAPWKDFQAMVEDARKRPGKIRASVPGVGTMSDLVVQQFNKLSGVRIATVPFTGGGPEAMVALIGGRVESFMGSVSGNVGQIKAGQIKAIAVFQKGKSELLPEATPVVDAGYPVTLQVAFYVFAPKDLPKPILDKLSAASLKIASAPDFVAFGKENDLVADVKGPADSKAELDQMGQVFRDLVQASKAK